MKYQGLAFKNRKIDFHKLKQYGFRQKDGSYIFNTKLKKGEFELILSISKIDDLDYKIIETSTDEEYEPAYIKNAEGKFVGEIRQEAEEIISDIAARCTVFTPFLSEYTYRVIDYIKEKYPDFYFVSSTTKVLTDFCKFENELNREDFSYVVPDFRLNKSFDKLKALSQHQKEKVEFLCNECCWFGCMDRKKCYETVSRKNLGEDCPEHYCTAPDAGQGYLFSKAMENPGFIGIDDIKNTYLPMGFSNFKIEGRGLGSAMMLEFLLYYMTKPQYQIHVREHIYLDNMLDLF